MAGAALLGGGYLAWHEHEKKKTEEEVSFTPHYPDFSLTYRRRKKQALTWGAQGWQTDAYARTQEIRNHGPRAPTTWVLVEGREKIPPSAIEAGRDKDNHPIYIARAYFEDSLRTFGWLSFFLSLMFHFYSRNW